MHRYHPRVSVSVILSGTYAIHSVEVQARLSLFRYLLGITRVVLLIYLTRYFMMDDPVILDTPQIMYPNG